MFYIIDKHNGSTLEFKFKSASKANKYAKKHLPRDKVRLWGEEPQSWSSIRYYVTRR